MAWPKCDLPLLSECTWRVFVRSMILCSALTLAACSVVGDMLAVEAVKPWQRGVLARDNMQLVTDVLEQNVDDHIYFSREASTGGVSVQGGGCGCN